MLRLKAPDISALLKEDRREARQGALPHFGKPMPLALDLLPAGNWEPAAGGRLWRLTIASPGARSLNFMFDKFFLPPGAELYLYNADRSVVMGPITTTQNTATKVFATDLLQGEAVTFELFEPVAFQGQSVLHADQVVHGYQDLPGQPYAGYGQSAPCNVDINCAAGNDWQTESNAVALLLLPNGQYSTGTLLNDNCQSLTPNFLTAYHSVNGLDASRMVFRFQYKSPTCAGPEGVNYLSFSGAQVVAAYEPTDFALLRLNQRPLPSSPIAYAGWSRIATPATSAATLHHAAGDVMKISLAPSGVQPFLSTYWHADFAVGTTQPGSSGAALFDQNHRVIGQLYGDATPDRRDYCVKHNGDYGRFDLSWTGGGTPQTRLSDWLTTDPSVAQVPALPVIPSIAGPDQVCAQSATFQANTSLVWLASPASLFSTTTGYGSQFTTAGAAGQAGVGVIMGKLPGACEASVTKTVRVGTEPSGYFYGGGISSSQNLQTVQFVTGGQISMFLNESATFTFSASSPAIRLSSYGRSTSFYLPPGQWVQINVSAPGSPCALAGSFVFAPRSVYYYRAAPNPVSDQLLVAAADPDQPADAPARPAQPAADSAAFATTLYDSYGRAVKTQRSARGQAVLDVRDLPNGLYHLRTGHGKEVITEHIRVAH